MARVPSSFDSKFLLEWKILYMPALYQVPLVYIWPEVVGYKIRTNEENTAFFSLETIDSAGLCKRRCIVSSRRKGYCVVGRQCWRQGHLFLLTHNSYYLFNDFYSKLKRKYDILELFREWKFNKHRRVCLCSSEVLFWRLNRKSFHEQLPTSFSVELNSQSNPRWLVAIFLSCNEGNLYVFVREWKPFIPFRKERKALFLYHFPRNCCNRLTFFSCFNISLVTNKTSNVKPPKSTIYSSFSSTNIFNNVGT